VVKVGQARRPCACSRQRIGLDDRKLIRERLAVGRLIAVGSELVLVGARLIAVSARLIGVRQRLIAVRSGLGGIRQGLLAIRERPIVLM